MSFGQRLRQRRMDLGLSRAELAERLGVSASAIGNYETDQNTVRSDLLPRLLYALQVDPNYLYQDYFAADFTVTGHERGLLERYRQLNVSGRQAVDTVLEALCGYQEDMEDLITAPEAVLEIPLYRSPAAAGYAAPVFGEDYDMIPVTEEVPRGAVFAVRLQGDSMEPYLSDGAVAYVNREALGNGDVGIFSVDGDMICKQYYRDALGMVYLYSVNRRRADADVVLPRTGGRTVVCLGKVMLRHQPPVPGS